MISYYIQIIFLALVQGIFEFIPVSSSAHLFIISYFSNFDHQSLELDISLHLGSLIAILIYFRKDLINILNNKIKLNLIVYGSIPMVVIGLFLHHFELIYQLRNLKVIAWTTLLFGIFLYLTDRNPISNKIDKNLNLKKTIIIGLYQALALIPGVSRSGIVISACRLYNFNRVDAAKISFLLSIPALTLGLFNTLDRNIEFNIMIFLSIFFSFIFSYLTIKFLLIYLKKFSLNIFVYYRIFLAIILFLIAYGQF